MTVAVEFESAEIYALADYFLVGFPDEVLVQLEDISLPIYVAGAHVAFDRIDVAFVDASIQASAGTVIISLSPVDVPLTDIQIQVQADDARVSLGVLPAGLQIVDNGDGTASLYGTPESGVEGEYRIPLVISNGISPDANEVLILKVV